MLNYSPLQNGMCHFENNHWSLCQGLKKKSKQRLTIDNGSNEG